MSHSKITIHRSANVAALLTKLPNDVANNIITDLDESKKNKLFVSVVSRSPRLQFKFVESFFQNAHIALSPLASPVDFRMLGEDTVACYYAQNEDQVLAGNNADITFWLIGINDEIDEDYGEKVRGIKGNLIPIILYSPEEYSEFEGDGSDFEIGGIKVKSDDIKNRQIKLDKVYHACLSNPSSMAEIGDKVISLLSGSRKVYGGLTFLYHCLSDEARRQAEDSYIQSFVKKIHPYYNTLSEEGKKELKTLFKIHFSEYVKNPEEEEEDVMTTIISAASNAAATAKTGIDSLIKTIKSKF